MRNGGIWVRRSGLVLVSTLFVFALGHPASARSSPDALDPTPRNDGIVPSQAPPQSAGLNPIERENALPGTYSWRIDPADLAMKYEIGGYIPMPSVLQGSQISVHTNRSGADTSRPYTVEVFRLGWYDGAGARLVYGPASEANGGNDLPIAEATDEATGLYEADWPVGFKLSTQTHGTPWTTGSYVVRLTANSGKQVYVPFTLKASAATEFLFLQSHLTWQAYNSVIHGGNSLYAWGSRFVRTCKYSVGRQCVLWSTPEDRLPHLPRYAEAAPQVSFNRPYPPWHRISDGAGEVLYYEMPLILWLEREGYDLSYAADFDLEFGRVPSGVRSIVLPSHSEYWTQTMRDNLESAQEQGGVGLASFGANQVYWRGRLKNSTPDDVGVFSVYKQVSGEARPDDPYYGDPSLETGTFREVGEPEQLLLGSQCKSFLRGVLSQTGKSYHGHIGLGPAVDTSHPLLAGTGIDAGDKYSALLGGEFDRVMTEFESLPNVEILFSTFVHQNVYASNLDWWNVLFCSWRLRIFCRHTRAHTVVVEKLHQDSAVVSRAFNAGTFNWSRGLSTFELRDGIYAWEDSEIQSLTRNILSWSAKLD